MPLTEIQAKKSKPREQAYKLADGEGLILVVQTQTDPSFGG